MKRVRTFICISAVLCALAVSALSACGSHVVVFVSDRDEPGNYDIYALNPTTNEIRRLTTHPAIDNHPTVSPDGTKIAWSSNRREVKEGAPVSNADGDFEILVADWSDTDYIDGPAGNVIQLTNNGPTDGVTDILPTADGTSQSRAIPDRHPHFSPCGTKIIYSAKYECLDVYEIKSECSIPIPVPDPHPCNRNCEGLRIMDIVPDPDPSRPHVGANMIDITSDMLTAANPIVWPQRTPDQARFVGHPSFSPDGTKIVFSGSVDGEGRDWEVYVATWDGTIVTELVQLTLGSTYPPNPNPIKMTGGAHFSHYGTEIIFTSTRTSLGNSQVFKLPANAVEQPVSPAIRLGPGSDPFNDYVPEPTSDGRIIVTSDEPTDPPVGPCATSDDLDLIIMDADGTNRVNLTDNELADEMLLIGDEVSWFCGLKPNLSPCTYYPKIMTIESLRIMRDSHDVLPHNFPKRELYPKYFSALNQFMLSTPTRPHLEEYWFGIKEKMMDPSGRFDNEFVVIPAPARFHVQNEAPSAPSNPRASVNPTMGAVQLAWDHSIDPEDGLVTYDVYVGTSNPPRVIAGADLMMNFFVWGPDCPPICLGDPDFDLLYWKVVAKDPHGGMTDGEVWSFSVAPPEPLPTVTQVYNMSAQFVIESSDGVVTTYPLTGVVVLKKADEVPPGDPIPIEIVALDLVSVEPIRVRLNPAIPSTGQTAITELPGGNWHVDSFFDIYTEIHLHDDGLLINPGPLRLEGSSEGEEPQSIPGEMEMPVGAPPVPICPGEDPGCELPRIIDVEWYEEGEGHPTHVSGTANTPLNGSAIVGTMPGSNELLLVDVFPSSPFGPEEFWSYACQQDRSAGIRIDLPNYSESLGGSGTFWRRVMVVGRTVLKDSELRIEAIYVEDMGPAEELRPLFVPIPRLGGAKFGHKPAVGSGAGLTNVGLLVKTSGRVTEVTPGSVDDHPYFYLEDSGSAVKVIVYSDAELLLSEGDFVDVTGFLGAEAAPTPECADCGSPLIHTRKVVKTVIPD